MDKLTSMRAFTRVVDTGSFSEAARSMRLSRSAISKYILDLEADLGVQLLHRTTRSATPTDNGRLYYERCVAILSDIDEADLTVSQHQATPRGVLRVNAPMSFGTLHLGKAIAAFLRRYPELTIHLILSDQQIDTVQEGFDVTIRIADMANSSLIARRIVPAHRVLCASPAYLDAHGTPEHPNDLRNHVLLSYDYLGTGAQWKLTGKDGDHWLNVRARLITNNAEILRDAAVNGEGIALLPTFIAGPDLRSGALRSVLTDYRAPQLSVCALYPPTRHVSMKVRAFIDFLIERFGDKPYWDEGVQLAND
jgi:DNA-binding transcriptional LysR family regulator